MPSYNASSIKNRARRIAVRASSSSDPHSDTTERLEQAVAGKLRDASGKLDALTLAAGGAASSQ